MTNLGNDAPARSPAARWVRQLARTFVATTVLLLAVGCGTTRSSDSMRTATEMMLMSSAIDKAVNEINFEPLKGKEVFLDGDRLKGFVDEHYVVSTLRQAMFASGVIVRTDRASAKYIVEARAGVLGTNSSSVMIGIPALSVPGANVLMPGAPSMIPEIPFAKTSRQAGIAKIALFAYNQQTGKPIWQSGALPTTSDAKNTWFFGAGPFQKGSIYGNNSGTKFVGAEKGLVPAPNEKTIASARASIPVTAEAVFDEPPEELASLPDKDKKDAAATPPKPATPPPAPPPVVPPVPQVSVPLDQSATTPASGIVTAVGAGILNQRLHQ